MHTNAAGPMRLGEGPYQGHAVFAATGTFRVLRDSRRPSNYPRVFPYQRTQEFRDRRLQDGGTVVLLRERG